MEKAPTPPIQSEVLTPQDNEFLVFFTYKGHSDSLVLKSTPATLYEDFIKKVKSRGSMDEIYYPGEWEYDLDTCSPRPLK
jgi:hypothetical protein